MPPGETSPWWRPSFRFKNGPARTRPSLLLPFRPCVFIAKRTLLFCVVLLISYVLITNMVGYERLWSSPAPPIEAATTARVKGDSGTVGQRQSHRKRPFMDAEGGASDTENGLRVAGGNNSSNERLQSVGEHDAKDPRPNPSVRLGRNYSTKDKKYSRSENGTDGMEEELTAKGSDSGTASRADRPLGRVDGAPVMETIFLNDTESIAAADERRRRPFDADKKNDAALLKATKLSLCPMPPPDLAGKMKQAVLLMGMLKESDVIRSHPELSRGGHWKPDNCKARHKIAVIVPFRDRQSHLNRLIDFLIPMLERQLIDFRFIVTEQYGKDLFNKGRIMNAAFLLAEKLGVDCVIFHDVDMFPQDDRNFYYCPDEPKHLGAFVNTLGYELWYDYIVGGVLAINIEHYRQINGYSNMYWAWGGEDDDMGYRILANNLTILRPEKKYGTYTMLKHVKRQRTAPSMIYKLLNTAKTRWTNDGLNRVEWKVAKLIVKPLYYHLYVDVGVPPDEWRHEKPTAKTK